MWNSEVMRLVGHPRSFQIVPIIEKALVFRLLPGRSPGRMQPLVVHYISRRAE
jgi:hypothetical protein